MRRNKDIRIGDRVFVNKDIYRSPNPVSASEAEEFRERRMNLCEDRYHNRHTCAPWCCDPQLYAKEGEHGYVVGFAPRDYLRFDYQPQVRMDSGQIKTFRTTSLQRIDDE